MLVDRADPASEAHSTAPDDLATLATSWRRTRWGARSAHQGEPDEEHAWSLTQASAPDRGSAPDTSTGSAKRPGRSSSAATRPSSVWPTRSSVTPSGAATRSLRSCGRTRQPGELPAGCASTPRPAPEVPSMAESTIAPSSRTLGQRPSLSALPPVLRGGTGASGGTVSCGQPWTGRSGTYLGLRICPLPNGTCGGPRCGAPCPTDVPPRRWRTFMSPWRSWQGAQCRATAVRSALLKPGIEGR